MEFEFRTISCGIGISIPHEIIQKESISPRLVWLRPRSWYKLSFQIKARNDSPEHRDRQFAGQTIVPGFDRFVPPVLNTPPKAKTQSNLNRPYILNQHTSVVRMIHARSMCMLGTCIILTYMLIRIHLCVYPYVQRRTREYTTRATRCMRVTKKQSC